MPKSLKDKIGSRVIRTELSKGNSFPLQAKQFLLTMNDLNTWTQEKIFEILEKNKEIIFDKCLCIDEAPTTGKKHFHLGLWLTTRMRQNQILNLFPGSNIQLPKKFTRNAKTNWYFITNYVTNPEHEHGEKKVVLIKNSIEGINPENNRSHHSKVDKLMKELKEEGIEKYTEKVKEDYSLIKYQKEVLNLESTILREIYFTKEFELSLPKPVWIFVYGETGSGKTVESSDIAAKLAKKGIHLQSNAIDGDKILLPKEIGVDGFLFNEFNWKGFFKAPQNILNLSDLNSVSRGFGCTFSGNYHVMIFNSINPPWDSLKDLEDSEKWKDYISRNRNIIAEFQRRCTHYVHCVKIMIGDFSHYSQVLTNSKNEILDYNQNWIDTIADLIIQRRELVNEYIKGEGKIEKEEEEEEIETGELINPPAAPEIIPEIIGEREEEEINNNPILNDMELVD